MKNIITLINPNLVAQRNDFFTTGIVYMPMGLAYFAASLQASGYSPKVIDAYGEDPGSAYLFESFLICGLSPKQVIRKIPYETKIVCLYAGHLTHHVSLLAMIRTLRAARDVSIVVLENSQAVTAYSLKHVQHELNNAGADYIVTGDLEERGIRLIDKILNQTAVNSLDGIGYCKGKRTGYTPPKKHIKNLDELALPAWDLFPLQAYWNLRYAHGPLASTRYLPIQTSRGCPYGCRFCVIPDTNQRKWRSRSPKHVVDEMAFFYRTFGIKEFHIEDLNPTVLDERIRRICREIIKRNLPITWKIAAGTKIECIRDETTIDLMARAGCRYISISPESGSPSVLKKMQKPFDLPHALKMVRRMTYKGIRSQACFVLGFPGETDEDLRMTSKMVYDLTRVGVDEIALFIMAPVPGADIFEHMRGYEHMSQLNFSPVWREDYRKLSKFRLRLYGKFILLKFMFHPISVLRQGMNFVMRRFETKMEMVPYRALKLKQLERKALHHYA